MSSAELREYIKRQKQRGMGNIQDFEIEYHKRYAMSFAAFILTIMGVSLSSRKRKGGMGLYLGIGLGLSFGYILFQTVSSNFAITGAMSAFWAEWLPNLIYVPIAVFLYIKAPK
jgi:lipopolysaccharide export system permease protein